MKQLVEEFKTFISKGNVLGLAIGIIIGVAAVIIMLAVGNGAQKSIQDDMKTMGTNLIMIRSGSETKRKTITI